MTFRSDTSEEFTAIFDRYKSQIRMAEGCEHLSLLQDKHRPFIFFTYSRWRSESDLENYRLSRVFGEVWPQVKPLFALPAEAWTVSESEV
jgi:quinol monooxygenase YgiN